MATVLTVQEILNCVKPMGELLEVPMPAQTALKLSRLVRELNKEIETVKETIDKTRESYIDADGKPKEDGATEKFQEELDKLMAEKIEFDFNKIDPSVIGGAPVKPGTLMALDWVFKD